MLTSDFLLDQHASGPHLRMYVDQGATESIITRAYLVGSGLGLWLATSELLPKTHQTAPERHLERSFSLG
jgi:hypothetical protein